MNHSPRNRTVVGCTLLVIALGAGLLTACSSDGHPLSAKPHDAAGQIAFNAPVDGSKKADPAKPLEITAEGSDARLTDVTATDARGQHVAGELSADGSRWHSTSPLAAGTRYTVRVSTEDEDGAPGRKVVTFVTSTPKIEKRLNVKFGPDAGKYGVGQPVTAELNAPVKDKASRAIVERGLRVDSVPAVEGAWHWVDDKTLHYRPKDYWPANASITAHSDLAGVKVAERLWGGEAKPLTLTTGDRVIAVTDAAAHSMTVYKNDEKINQIPVTTGKPGYETRNGIKVVLAKESTVRMTSASIGASDFYDLIVHYATRVTQSGEYVHAAPWSEGSQGSANVRFFDTVRPGDIVKVENSNGDTMAPFGNGFGDWNLSWENWRTGSALLKGTPDEPSPADKARLRPESA